MSSRAVFTMILTTAFGSFKEVDMELTMTEKRNLIEKVKVLALNDILTREDRDDIIRICLVACDRELAKMKEEHNG